MSASAARWFGAGFLEREPARASALLHALRDATDEGYVAVCRALRSFDVRDRLGEIAAPVRRGRRRPGPDLPAGGAPADRRRGRPTAGSSSSTSVAHQAPAEAPEEVARIIRELAQEVAT